MRRGVRWLMAVYALLMRLLPGGFRGRYGAELRRLVARRLGEEHARGRRAMMQYWLREIVDLPKTAVRVRLTDGPATHGPSRSRFEMRGLLREVRWSLRALLRAPAFLLLSVATLSAGVGCAAAAFGVLDALLIRPLPHPGSDQLVMVWNDLARLEMNRAPISYPTLQDLRSQSAGVFAGIEAYAGGTTALLQNGVEPERANGARVTGGLFALLGNRPVLGRTILPADDVAGAEPVVVLSHALWLRYFGGDAGTLGRTISVRGATHRIVGVMGPEFVFPSVRAELWVPLRPPAEMLDRDLNFLVAIARLRPGTTLDQARQRVGDLHARLRTAYPEAYRDARLRLETRYDYIVGDVKRMVLVGSAAAALLLLIACANLGNLVLVRGLARTRELALRGALGASRLRLFGEQVTESLLIGLAAAGFGTALAYALTRLVVTLAPETFPRRAELGVDVRMLGFAAAAGVCAVLLSSLGPLLHRADSTRALLATAGGSLTRRSRASQSALMVAQISLALVLLVTAGLLTTTLVRLLSVPLGFDGSHVLTAHLSLPDSRYDSTERHTVFYNALFARLRALPGVERVGGTWALPFSEDYASSAFVPADRPQDPPLLVSAAPVRGDYFNAVGMRLLRGRRFDDRETPEQPAFGIINQTLANRFWPGRDPIGQRMVDPEDPDDHVTIIGVVNDVRRTDLTRDVQPEVYLSYDQSQWTGGSMYVTVRTTGDPLATGRALRNAVYALDPQLPVARVSTLDALVLRSVAHVRFRAIVLASLAAAAALLTLLGIYSVQSVFVSHARRDLAVRLALGARPGRLIREVVGSGLRLTVVGIAIGGALAAVAARSLNALLFDLSPRDPGTYVRVSLLFLAAGALACWVPARRVGRVDPMSTLRQE